MITILLMLVPCHSTLQVGGDGEDMRKICENKNFEPFGGVFISAQDLARVNLKILGHELPKFVQLGKITLLIILLPFLKVLWDVVDVAMDTYYFQSLENGGFIDSDITRNTGASNTMFLFAVLGAIKSTVLAYGFCLTIEYELQGTFDIRKVFVLPILYSFKILLEDGPELFLKFFFVERYVTKHQPWLLVLKDSITASSL